MGRGIVRYEFDPELRKKIEKDFAKEKEQVDLHQLNTGYPTWVYDGCCGAIEITVTNCEDLEEAKRHLKSFINIVKDTEQVVIGEK